MNAFSVVFTLACGLLLATLPRRWAAVPLLLGAVYATPWAVLSVGPANFTVLRILVAVGVVRTMFRGETPAHGIIGIDRFVVLWALVLMATSVFHTSDAWVFRAGMLWSDLGTYYLLRVFVRDADEVRAIFRWVCILLLPVAMLMVLEKATSHNFFTALGGFGDVVTRDGKVRARGPFVHPILAGTVGATAVPIAIYLWRQNRRFALTGFCAAAGIVLASTSSGPIMMVLFLLLGMCIWKVRSYLSAILWSGLLAVIALDIVMKDPVYFLMARIDITGGSTGWHRARLIQSALQHINEWWFAGTDYTRHWMPTGIHANERHTDITNHLLAMGILGGLPLVLAFVLLLASAFRSVGRALRDNEAALFEHRFLIWTLGAMLFGHVMNFFSISLFDQSVVFLYLVLASIGALQYQVHTQRTKVETTSRVHRQAALGPGRRSNVPRPRRA